MEYNIVKICRICLSEGDNLKSIFYNEEIPSDHVSVSNKIMACSSIQVAAGDGLPELICSKCLTEVDIAYDFKEKSQSADAALRKYISLVCPLLENSQYYGTQLKQVEEIIPAFNEQEDMDVKYNLNVYEFDKEVSNLKNEKFNSDEGLSDYKNNDVMYGNEHQFRKRKREKTQVTKYKKSKSNKSCTAEEFGNGNGNGNGNEDKNKGGKSEEEKDITCSICKKSFAYLCILKDHMVQHTGAKPFLCSVCGKSFSHTASLSNHMRTHSRNKPHKCDTCNLSFHRRAHLVHHTRTHTGEKPFVCEVCGRNFAQSSYLKEHMRLHSGEKPFVCDICGHGFARKSCLVMHRRVHTGELPYECPECGRAFSQRSQRKRHVKRNHKGSPCLRPTGELILKDVDLRNKASAQEELGSENSVNTQNDSLILDRDLGLQRPNPAPIANSNFRDLTIFQHEQSQNLSSPTIPLVQIHRTLLQ